MNKNYSYQITIYKSFLSQMYVYIIFDFHNELAFQESDVSPCQTEVKQESLLNLYPVRRVILENLINHKT